VRTVPEKINAEFWTICFVLNGRGFACRGDSESKFEGQFRELNSGRSSAATKMDSTHNSKPAERKRMTSLPEASALTGAG
jgi:hypothetical protein